MALGRRRFLAGALLATLGTKVPRAEAQPAVIDSAPMLQRDIDAAARLGRVALVPSGISYVSRLRLPANVRLVGAGPSSRLLAISPGPMLSAEHADSIVIENITFDGNGQPPQGESGLVEARNIRELRLTDCTLAHVAGYGLRLEGCGGVIARSTFRAIGESALWSMDGAGLNVVDNRIEDCGNNGAQIWRSSLGDDGSILRGNRFARIRADRGGDGPYGNAINVFRAGGVICEGNEVRASAFSAIRCNAASNATISANNCADLGEVAIYVEFGFEGAVVEGNLVDGAACGISLTNFDQGGRLAACTGNVVRNLDRRRPQGDDSFGIGIHVEADTVVSANAVDRAENAGLRVGFGTGLRNVVATSNTITDCGVGIDVSVAPNAGSASILNNTILHARRGAIVGMAWDKVVAPDLLRDASRYPQLTISGNQVS